MKKFSLGLVVLALVASTAFAQQTTTTFETVGTRVVNTSPVTPIDQELTSTPTRNEIQAIQDKVNQLVALTRGGTASVLAVTVSPESLTLAVNATAEAEATHTNLPTGGDNSVTWTVTKPDGTAYGANAGGTVSAEGTLRVVYTAPASTPDPATPELRATSDSDPSKYDAIPVYLSE